MTKCLVVVAHPSKDGFTNEIARRFAAGLKGAMVDSDLVHLYQDGVNVGAETFNGYDGLALVFPNWCEMPPAPMVEWVQRAMSPGVGYSKGPLGEKIKKLTGMPCQVMISQGTDVVKDHIIGTLREALGYCGVETESLVFPNVGKLTILGGPNYERNLDVAEHVGRSFKTRMAQHAIKKLTENIKA